MKEHNQTMKEAEIKVLLKVAKEFHKGRVGSDEKNRLAFVSIFKMSTEIK